MDEQRWPGPTGPASRTVLAAAVGSGVIAALTLVLTRPGLGWLIAGLAVAGTAVAAGRRTRPSQLAWGAAALGLLAVGAIRAEGWRFLCSVLGAPVAGSRAPGGGRAVPVPGLGVPLDA